MIENKQPDHIPPFSEITDAYQEVLSHNSRHTGFGGLFSGITKAMGNNLEVMGEDTNTDDTYKLINETMQGEKVSGDMHGELVGMMSDDLFTRIGVKVLPAGSRVVDGGEKVSTSTELVPFIANTSLFSDFLKTVNPDQAQTDEGEQLLVDSASNLKWVIDKAFGPSEDDDLSSSEQLLLREAGEDALRTWNELEDEYKRIGFSAESLRGQLHDPDMVSDVKSKLRIFGNLEQYVEYWGKGLLPEFIEGSNSGFVTSEDEYYGFHPINWASDMTPEKLSDGWEQALDYVERLGHIEGSEELVQQARKNLKRSLEVSLQYMRTKELDLQDGSHLYYRDNRQVLEAVKLRFDQL